MISSLLFDQSVDSPKENCLSNRVIQDLLISEIVSFMHRKEEISRKAVRLLSVPCTNEETIVNRQKCLCDFQRYPDVFETLTNSIRRIQEKILGIQEQRRDYRKNPYNYDNHARMLSVRDTANMVIEVLNEYSLLLQVLNSKELTSNWLQQMRKDLEDTINHPEFLTVHTYLCSLSELRLMDSSYVIEADLGEEFNTVTYSLIESFQHLNFKKSPGLSAAAFVVNDRFKEIITQAIDQSMPSLSYFLWEIGMELAKPFLSLQEDLLFYDFSLRYLEILKSKKIHYIWPQITREEKNNYVQLRDIYLSLSQEFPPVPNDYIETPLTIITGANGCGKTVFLRSIGAAQLFAQAGLPIPAKQATVRVVNQIYTHFAVGENNKGRFEEECESLSKITDSITPEDMLLLNEPFQSTVYEEGRRLLLDILPVFMQAKIPVILVSHLFGLAERTQISLYRGTAFYFSDKAFTFRHESMDAGS